jgi:membrane associated rhomboid family serine protease
MLPLSDGVAFFARVGGFIFGVAVVAFLSSVGRVAPQGGRQASTRFGLSG